MKFLVRAREMRSLNLTTVWTAGAFAAFLALPWAIISCGTAPTASVGASAQNANSGATTPATSTVTSGSVTKCVAISQMPTCADKTAAPSYNDTVQNVIVSWCLDCHDPNGIGTISGSKHPGPPRGAAPADPNNPNAFVANDPNRPSFRDPNQYDPGASRDWSDYNNIVKHAQDMLESVADCSMPRGAVMTTADKTALMQWLACGAPDN